MTPEGVSLVTMAGYGAGAAKGTGDIYYTGANPAGFLSGGDCSNGVTAGSSYLSLNSTLGLRYWYFSARD
jgi:hypothetical protein